MKQFFKNLGVFLLLAGVCMLAVPFFFGFQTNKTLFLGLGCVITGFIGHVFLMKWKS